MDYLAQFLDDCTVTVLDADYTHCWQEWEERDYIPPYNKLYFIQSGEGELVVDGAVYHPKPGELFLMPAGVRQSYYTVSENCYTKYWCHFTALSGGVRLFDAVRTPLCVEVSDPDGLRERFSRVILGVNSPDPLVRLRGKAAMLDILAAYLSDAGKAVALSENLPADKLMRLTGYISAHLGEEITLEDLAAIVHLHPNYFISFFRKYFGVTPLKYVAAARLDRAKQLLRTTDKTVAQVAEETGFHDMYHFSRQFKVSTGYAPSDFRRLRQEEPVREKNRLGALPLP